MSSFCLDVTPSPIGRIPSERHSHWLTFIQAQALFSRPIIVEGRDETPSAIGRKAPPGMRAAIRLVVWSSNSRNADR
ncbi:hypothetical protein chiPu_0027391 [Chiloscyllium punctatum]|uniref:Uncharacterized protein n=1 Tax=Chiloscyllium punctatum TaxID=137246 RepID=A0A401TL14_CHIPU|nr:hypothetical protein [Chiloscyllium punctatum]